MYEDISAQREALALRRRPWRAMAGLTLLGFVLGAALVWALAGTPGLPARWTGHGVPVAVPQALAPAAAPSGAAVEAHQAAQQVAQVAQQQGGLDQRVAALEQRLSRLDLQAQAAEGNAGRAEGLLIAFAARRSLERGAPLGYLEDQLKLRFGDARPNAVQAVIDDAHDPVTLDQLLARLSGLAPGLAKRPSGQGVLAWLSREMSQMFVVRRADSPSPAAENRIERARLFLETGRADLAAQEVRRLPNAAAAQDWIADAERYASAQRALDLLEMAAIQDPRGVNDSTGHAIQQPSPAGPAGPHP